MFCYLFPFISLSPFLKSATTNSQEVSPIKFYVLLFFSFLSRFLGLLKTFLFFVNVSSYKGTISISKVKIIWCINAFFRYWIIHVRVHSRLRESWGMPQWWKENENSQWKGILAFWQVSSCLKRICYCFQSWHIFSRWIFNEALEMLDKSFVTVNINSQSKKLFKWGICFWIFSWVFCQQILLSLLGVDANMNFRNLVFIAIWIFFSGSTTPLKDLLCASWPDFQLTMMCGLLTNGFLDRRHKIAY